MNALSLFDNFVNYPNQDQTAISNYLTGYPLSRICVVSDTQYAEILKAQAEREVGVLESQKSKYLNHIEQLDLELTKIKTEAGLLPAEVTTDSSMN